MSSADFLDRLGEALREARIRGALRQRILTEFEDHLASDPDAALGDPGDLAAQFADELGTSRARGAAFAAFAALVLVAVLLVSRMAAMGPLSQIDGSFPDTLGLLGAIFAAQIAFVSGGLALLRAFRLRRLPTIPAAEARILARRAGVGLAAGALATVAVPLRAAAPGAHPGSSWWSVVTVAGALVAVALALPAVIRAVRVRPRTEGAPGDLLDDFGPVRPLASSLAGASPTRFALLSAGGIFAAIAVAGVAAGDPYDGIARALLETVAYLGCYALLGRYLGLRTAGAAAPPSPQLS